VSRSPAEGIDIEQELHQRIIDRRRARLNEKDVLATYEIINLHVDFGIGQIGRGATSNGYAQVGGDLLGQGLVGASGKDTEWMSGVAAQPVPEPASIEESIYRFNHSRLLSFSSSLAFATDLETIYR
jgi:hypothetical protein